MKDDALVAGSEDVRLTLSNTLALTPTTQWIPVMVMPFTGAGTELTITVYGKPDAATTADDTTEEPTAPAVMSATRTLTIPAGTADFTSNSIAYISVKDIEASEPVRQHPKPNGRQAMSFLKTISHGYPNPGATSTTNTDGPTPIPTRSIRRTTTTTQVKPSQAADTFTTVTT